jgi:NurA-like 5'-3' nuclease
MTDSNLQLALAPLLGPTAAAPRRRTTRERKAAKAARLREAAEKRREKAAALYARGEPLRDDYGFATQPGHDHARARILRAIDKGYEVGREAEALAARAAGIERQLGRSIYSDDPDALEALRRRIAELEAKSARMKAFNAALRADPSRFAELAQALTPREREDLEVVARW